ncbi:MAG: hypothetical protein E6J00_07085 [Chloroflexi bacterium]|nr:MAG: hypothetical protein E6J00_07085 [Chloroflexota bacterium]
MGGIADATSSSALACSAASIRNGLRSDSGRRRIGARGGRRPPGLPVRRRLRPQLPHRRGDQRRRHHPAGELLHAGGPVRRQPGPQRWLQRRIRL